MRKYLFALPLILLFSCGAIRLVAEIGMSESEFKRKNYGYNIAEMREGLTIYRVIHDDSPDRLVYFENGFLTRVEEIPYFPPPIIYPF